MDSDRDRLVHKDRVFVGKIPKGTTEHELRAVFENIGLKVSHISIQPSPRDMDFGFVTFNDERSVSKALEMVRPITQLLSFTRERLFQVKDHFKQLT